MVRVFITSHDVYFVDSAPKKGVRSYILNNQRLHEEFKKFQRNTLNRWNDYQALKDITGDLDKFAEHIGIKVIKELGRRIVENEHNHFQIDIDYEIEYPFQAEERI